MSLSWDDMRVFLAVARKGSLSAAARVLKVTQPTVGRRLRALEDSLSARLFERLPDGFVPTPAGEELLPLAEAMEQTAEAIARRQATLADRVSGTIRLSVFEISAQFLTNHLPELKARLPEVEFEVAISHVNANLSKREADLILRACLPENPTLIARKLGAISYAVYGESGLVDRLPAARMGARYRECPWVGYDDEHAHFDTQRWLAEKLAERQPSVRVNNALVMFDAVRKGAGLGVLPCFSAFGDPALVQLTPPVQELEREQHLIVHPDLRRVPLVRAVMDELVHLFRREAPKLLGQVQLQAPAA
jgi:DNA-binding transcriptional LysR family regulator